MGLDAEFSVDWDTIDNYKCRQSFSKKIYTSGVKVSYWYEEGYGSFYLYVFFMDIKSNEIDVNYVDTFEETFVKVPEHFSDLVEVYVAMGYEEPDPVFKHMRKYYFNDNIFKTIRMDPQKFISNSKKFEDVLNLSKAFVKRGKKKSKKNLKITKKFFIETNNLRKLDYISLVPLYDSLMNELSQKVLDNKDDDLLDYKLLNIFLIKFVKPVSLNKKLC